ncbi:MAG: nucleoside deaminase [Candidatus Omnitrophica bacterium]|nr:nucleoside deaminase [Candidatus Omnitrophota bacterium]
MATKVDEQFMREALKEAEAALLVREKPVGAVIAQRSRLVARAYHQTKTLRDPTAHAAIIAITQAANALQAEQLATTTLYVTQEPCCMCIGAILVGGVGRLVIGAEDSRQGACGSAIDIPANERLNKKLALTKGVLVAECSAILRRATVSARA